MRRVLNEVDERLAALGFASPVADPVQVARPTALLRQAVRVRDGRRERDALCELDTAGIRLTDRRSALTIAWRDARSIIADRGRVQMITSAGTVSLAIALDGVVEPGLSALFAQVLIEGRNGVLDPHTGALHELTLGIDRAIEAFGDADDPIVPLIVAGFALMVGLVLMAAIPTVLQLAARVAPRPGGFAILPRISSFDPRTLVAAFAAGAALAAAVGRAALGPPAASWARGTLRGWHRGGSGPLERARRAVAWLVLGSRTSLMAAAVALLVLAPSAFARTLIDADGIHSASGLPFGAADRRWSDVRDVVPVAVSFDERSVGFETVLVLADGSRVSTRGRDLIGGTQRAFFDFARAAIR